MGFRFFVVFQQGFAGQRRAESDSLLEHGTKHATESSTAAMNETHHSPALEPGAFRLLALDRLRAAGDSGLSASQLVDTKKAALRADRQKLIAQLLAAGEVQQQRKGSTVRYWLQGQMPVQVTPEEKADEALRRLLPEQRRGRLFTQAKIQSELLKGLGIKAPAVLTCLRLLEQQRLLVRFTDGAKIYFAYAPALRDWLDAEGHPMPEEPAAAPPAEPPVAPPAPSFGAAQVIDAYRAVRAQRRMPDVEIARLKEALGCTPEQIKPLVLQLCEQGVFIPGKGDWSFASPAARAAAILVQNEPYLFVRMKEE